LADVTEKRICSENKKIRSSPDKRKLKAYGLRFPVPAGAVAVCQHVSGLSLLRRHHSDRLAGNFTPFRVRRFLRRFGRQMFIFILL